MHEKEWYDYQYVVGFLNDFTVHYFGKVSTTTFTISLDTELKEQAEKLFASYGIDLSTAINLFVKKCVEERRIPCVTLKDNPGELSLEALEEVRRIKENPAAYIFYDDVDEMMKDLLS